MRAFRPGEEVWNPSDGSFGNVLRVHFDTECGAIAYDVVWTELEGGRQFIEEQIFHGDLRAVATA